MMVYGVECVIINNMSKTIINVSNDFFDVGGKEGDMMYSFTGNNACGLTKNNVLSGKTVNLSEMYDIMLDDVRKFLFGGEFNNIIEQSCAISATNIWIRSNSYRR